MPENTIPAMLKAIDLGVTTLEMDVVFTKDNVAILSHEPFFSHEISTNPDGKIVDAAEEKSLNIYKMTFAQTQKYDVGTKQHSPAMSTGGSNGNGDRPAISVFVMSRMRFGAFLAPHHPRAVHVA